MRKLLLIPLLFAFLNPLTVFATESAITTEPAVTTTETAVEEEPVTETAITEGEGENAERTFVTILVEFYNQPEVQSSISIVVLGAVSVLTKSFLSSNKKFLSKTQSILDRGGDILTIKDEAHQTWEAVKTLMATNEHLKSKVERIEKGEAYIGNLLKDFVRATNIKVDDKIDLAKKFDEFKAFIEEEGLDETKAYQEIKSTMDEFKEKIKETNQEDLEKVDSYLQNLKAISNDDEL